MVTPENLEFSEKVRTRVTCCDGGERRWAAAGADGEGEGRAGRNTAREDGMGVADVGDRERGAAGRTDGHGGWGARWRRERGWRGMCSRKERRSAERRRGRHLTECSRQ